MKKGFYSTQKLLLLVLMLFALVDVQAQLLTIPTGNPQGTTGTRRPYGCFFGYERTALIYLQSEINTAGNITSVGFYVDAVNNPAASTPIKIYMKTTTANDFGSGTNIAVEFADTVLVYTGTVTSAELVPGQWVTKTLNSPFLYDNTRNLEIIVAVEYGGGGGETSSAAKTFRVGNSTGSTYRFQYWYQDNSVPIDNGTTSSNRPNVQLNLTPLVACSGRPTAGNTIASAASVCYTDNLGLSISGVNNTSGISYQWISSADGVNYTNIANATNAVYSTNQTAATYYRNIVTCTNGGLKDTSTAVFVGQTICFCEPTAGCGSSDRIDTVIFAGINNYTGCSGSSAYAFYSTPVASVQAGSSYPIIVYVANGGQENVGVWVDFNQNGIFETTEYTDLGTKLGGANFMGAISIPGNALLGNTRMRVRAKYANNTPLTSADACLSYTFGETEDYLVNITSSTNCSGRPTAGNTLASANPVCNTDNLSLSISGSNNTAGITYQWQSSANGVTYTNISNANSPGYTTNQAAATYYRNIVTCSTSGLKDTSAALLVNQNLCYCTVSSDCDVNDRIDTVIFAGINSYTTCGANGYSYYPTPVAQVQRGTAVPISVYVTDGGRENVGVWIDYDQNGTFDAAEFTDLGWQANGDTFFYGSVNIPLNASLGITRMRVRDRYGDTVLTNTDACYTYSYGETEDYLVNITAAPACATPSVGGIATGPSAGQLDSVITFTLTGSTGNIQWQFSTTSANGPFNDFPGYTQPTIQIAFNGIATFYLRAFVTSPGCTPDSSNVVSIVVTKRGNDVCDAIPLNFGVNGPFNTVGATTQAGEPVPPATGCQTQTGWCTDSVITNTLWFKFVAPASGRVRIQSPDFDTQLALWDAPNCASILTGGATLVKANDDDADYQSHNGESGSSFIDSATCLTPGKTYYVQLDAYDEPGEATDIILTDLGAGPNASFTNLAAGYCITAPAVTLTPAVAGGTFSGPGVSGNTFTAATAGLGGPYVITYSLYACYATSDTVMVNNGPGVTAIISPVSCNGGSNGAVDITVTNGTGNYSYTWSNTPTTQQDISGVTAGSYRVSVMDNTSNCSVVSSAFVVTEPSQILATLDSIVNVKCNGASTGAVYVSIAGGTPPYIYQWSNNTSNQDLTNAPAGSYTATVTDANSCQLSTQQPFVITQPTAIVITKDSADDNVCGANNGALYISVTGGKPGPDYTYLWSNQQTTQDITGLSTTTYTVVVTDTNSCTASASFAVIDDTPLSLTAVITPDSCGSASTGAINITVTGGSGNYTYNWSSLQTSEDITALAEGSYTVSVDDINSTCSVTNTFFVVNTLPPTVTFSVHNVSCFGADDGSINVTAFGGSLPYSFDWSPNVGSTPVNLSGGTYTITVTDNLGCTASYSVTLSEPDALIVVLDSVNVRCYGENTGAVAAIPSGGTMPYEYLWANNQTDSNLINLPAGKYIVQVSDSNGCQTSDSVLVTQAPQIAATVDSVIGVKCFGNSTGAIYTTLSGGTGNIGINWNTTPPSTTGDITGLAVGNYTATVSDANGCSVNVSQTITGPAAALNATSVATDQTPAANGAINVTTTGGSAPYISLWSNNAATEDLNNVPAGVYTVLITDTNGCTFSLTDTVKLATGIGVAGLQNSFDVNLYPNPTQDKVFIELSLAAAGNVTVQIYNVEGRLINEFTDKNILTTRYQMSFATEAAGIYLAKIKAGDAVVTKRFTVVK